MAYPARDSHFNPMSLESADDLCDPYSERGIEYTRRGKGGSSIVEHEGNISAAAGSSVSLMRLQVDIRVLSTKSQVAFDSSVCAAAIPRPLQRHLYKSLPLALAAALDRHDGGRGRRARTGA